MTLSGRQLRDHPGSRMRAPRTQAQRVFSSFAGYADEAGPGVRLPSCLVGRSSAHAYLFVGPDGATDSTAIIKHQAVFCRAARQSRAEGAVRRTRETDFDG